MQSPKVGLELNLCPLIKASHEAGSEICPASPTDTVYTQKRPSKYVLPNLHLAVTLGS